MCCGVSRGFFRGCNFFTVATLNRAFSRAFSRVISRALNRTFNRAFSMLGYMRGKV